MFLNSNPPEYVLYSQPNRGNCITTFPASWFITALRISRALSCWTNVLNCFFSIAHGRALKKPSPSLNTCMFWLCASKQTICITLYNVIQMVYVCWVGLCVHCVEHWPAVVLSTDAWLTRQTSVHSCQSTDVCRACHASVVSQHDGWPVLWNIIIWTFVLCVVESSLLEIFTMPSLPWFALAQKAIHHTKRCCRILKQCGI